MKTSRHRPYHSTKRRALQACSGLLAALALLAPLPAHAERVGGQPPLPAVELKVGQVTVRAEIADDSNEQATGLMRVTRLGDNDGMLFVNEKPRQVAFWMRNTLIPLTIAYLGADGTIKELHDMVPRNEESVPSSTDDIAFVLEMNLHWFKINGIRIGDVITPVGTTWEKLTADAAP